jgi:hypothetical protein
MELGDNWGDLGVSCGCVVRVASTRQDLRRVIETSLAGGM